MGEVYKARDTRLDRIVAIKVLTPDLEVAPRGRERFEREARAISKLSHPHICAIYDVGEAGGHAYVAMEFIDGQPLNARLAARAMTPDLGSIFYWPARAMLGDRTALAGVAIVGFLLLVAAIIAFSPHFQTHVIAATSLPSTGKRQRSRSNHFRAGTPKRALRHKEWLLLLRDPWLISQTLMQILYLLPPWLLLWRSFEHGGAVLVLVPVLTMAAGQLAGGLAWLAISGEDAPDLVATAPVPPRAIVSAKIEAVLGGVAVVFLPVIAALAFLVPFHGLVAVVGIVVAAASATQIQLWFRSQAKRDHFRHRLVSSRTATFAETFSSMAWAVTAALATSGSWHAVLSALIAIALLIGARLISRR
jgi:ABC-2 type transport system permease protein